jgi:hypothetical protein
VRVDEEEAAAPARRFAAVEPVEEEGWVEEVDRVDARRDEEEEPAAEGGREEEALAEVGFFDAGWKRGSDGFRFRLGPAVDRDDELDEVALADVALVGARGAIVGRPEDGGGRSAFVGEDAGRGRRETVGGCQREGGELC